MKKTLLCALGLTPQILTETIYALSVGSKTRAPWIPDEIFVVTTERGYRNIQLELTHPQSGQLNQLCKDYGLPALSIPEENIVLLKSGDGAFTDIRTPEDNANAGNQIAEIVQRLTADPDRELHVSLAGGRKTMGFYLGYALGIYGREQDRLSHVLVDGPYENLKDFYYPTPYSKVVRDNTDQPFDASEARVMLGEIPFFSLRGHLPRNIVEAPKDFSKLISLIKQMTHLPKVKADLHTGEVWIDDTKVSLTPKERAMYTFALWLKKENLLPNNSFNCSDLRHSVLLLKFTQTHEDLYGYSRIGENLLRQDELTWSTLNLNYAETLKTVSNQKNIDTAEMRSNRQKWFMSCKSFIKTSINQSLSSTGFLLKDGLVNSLCFEKTGKGSRGVAIYGLHRLAAEQITLTNKNKQLTQLEQQIKEEFNHENGV